MVKINSVPREYQAAAIQSIVTAAAIIKKSRFEVNDPVEFCRDTLGHDIWELPVLIHQALNQPRARVAVKSCHASGKSFSAAEAALYYVKRGAKVIVTAPTWTQVKRVLWVEIAKAYQGSKRRLGGHMFTTELRYSPDNFLVGISTNEGVNFQGYHAGDKQIVLLILDEAVGIAPDIWEAIEGIRAGGDVRVLVIGNPTIPSGPFYDCFTSQLNSWQTFTIDALHTPNFLDLCELTPGETPEQLAQRRLLKILELPDHELDENIRPYLTTRRWVKEKWEEWGPESPLWQARVRGMFPEQAEDSLLPLNWLERARVKDGALGKPVEAGVDVAGPGEDETVVCIRAGDRLVTIRGWAKPDPRGEVLQFLAPYKEQLRVVRVDSVGIGYYMARHLQDAGYPVMDVNVGEKANDPEKFYDLKAELYWGLRALFQEDRISNLSNDRLISQLSGIRYQPTPKGLTQIESKKDARARGVRSPDFAEALMLAYGANAQRVPPPKGVYVDPPSRRPERESRYRPSLRLFRRGAR